MKLILLVSLILNVLLIYSLMTRGSEKVIVERKIIETHPAQRTVVDTRKVIQPEVPEKKKKVEETARGGDAEFRPLYSQELQEAGEKMEADRLEFFTVQLEMTPEKIEQHNKIKQNFLQKSSALWEQNLSGEPSFEERKKLIELEEEFHRNLERLHGKENWERYRKFREEYNQKGFKLQEEHNQPFIFMEL